MAKKYLVSLTEEERESLLALTKKGSVAARKLTRAHILLQADAGATDDTIAQALHSGTATVERIRKRWFSKRKGLATLIREALFKEESALQDNDATNQTEDADLALQELGADAVAAGYATLTIIVAEQDEQQRHPPDAVPADCARAAGDRARARTRARSRGGAALSSPGR